MFKKFLKTQKEVEPKKTSKKQPKKQPEPEKKSAKILTAEGWKRRRI